MENELLNLSYVINHTPIKLDEYTSLTDLFEQCCQKFSSLPAYANMGETLTFAKLHQHAHAFAAYLQQELGMQKGERVALMMPNLLQYPIAFFGTLSAGLVAVNVNPLYTSRELKHQLQDSGVTAIVVLSNFANVLSNVIKETQIKHIILTEVGDLLPLLKGSVINFAVKYIKHMVPKFQLDNTIKFKQILRQGKRLQLNALALNQHDLALLQYTGGTTGVAKGAMLSHGNLLANGQQMRLCLPIHEGKEIFITALPLYHVFACTVNCLLPLIIGALSVLITNPRDIADLIKQISKYPYTVFIGVNTLFNTLLSNEKFNALNFSSLRVTVGGGMAVQKIVAEKWHALTGSRLLMGYGLTETSPVVALEPYTEKEFTGTIGLPIAATEVSVRDEKGNVLPRGEEGELCVQGPQVMQGYWQQPVETHAVMLPDGWLKTGDMARIEVNDYIRLVDRKKDLILISGFKVFPNEVEEVLAAYPGVQEVACIGIPNRHSGEAVKVFIVPKPGTELDKQEIRTYCQENLTGYKIPRYIEFRDSLPKSNIGKILRRTLREEEKQHPENEE